jgi:phenylalanyl-tRNA synthetase alpha chain
MTNPINQIKADLNNLSHEAQATISQSKTLEELEKLRVLYFGKKGQLSQILRAMGKLTSEERPHIGQIANEVRDLLQIQLDQRLEKLQREQIEARLAAETLDVTMPGVGRRLGHIHPLNQTIDKILDIFVGMGYSVATGPQVETDYYNFAALNIPEDHPARDMQDTFFFSDGRLLRTHTSPVQIRYMENHRPPIRIVAPGRVYRRDTVDSTHSAVFHQVEILLVGEGITFTDLRGTIKAFLVQMFGEDLAIRFRASYFPFTEPSAEVDIEWKGKWLEVLGCGMVDPNVLQSVGYDPEIYTGFAAGFGVERFAMVLHQIDDIRRLYNSDLRFLTQF